MSTGNCYVVSIAGFDPCGGAGVLADIKTFEAAGVIGFGVSTCITYQTENKFLGLQWLDQEVINRQITTLLEKYNCKAAKIGLIKDFQMLTVITKILKENKIQIVWDPVLSSSSGFNFHDKDTISDFEGIIGDMEIITPNIPEAEKLFGDKDTFSGAFKFSKYCNVLLKGGHGGNENAEDHLFLKNGGVLHFKEKRRDNDKHGTGCVLSSYLAAELGKKVKLPDACINAKKYVSKFIDSSDSLLGFHYKQEE